MSGPGGAFTSARCACGSTLRYVDDGWYICRRCGDEYDEATLRSNRHLAEGDRIYRWWDAGIAMTVQPLTVIRANRTTVTVDTDEGGRFRLPYADVAGYYDEDDDE